MEDAPLSKPLVDFVREHVSPVKVPWLTEATSGEYLGMNIKSIETFEKSGKEEKLRGPRKRRRKGT